MSASTNPQHMDALAIANRVKANRHAIKSRVASGEITVADVVVANPPDCASMTVYALLAAQTRWGRARASRFLLDVGMSETRTVGALTQRERLRVEAEWTRCERTTAHGRRYRAERDEARAAAVA